MNLNSPQNQSIGKSFFGRMKNCKSLQKTRTYCKKMHVFKLWPKIATLVKYIGHNTTKYSKRSKSERGLYNRTNTIFTLLNHISMKQNSLMPIVYGQSIHIIYDGMGALTSQIRCSLTTQSVFLIACGHKLST